MDNLQDVDQGFGRSTAQRLEIIIPVDPYGQVALAQGSACGAGLAARDEDRSVSCHQERLSNADDVQVETRAEDPLEALGYLCYPFRIKPTRTSHHRSGWCSLLRGSTSRRG